jgi:hypothetical protein
MKPKIIPMVIAVVVTGSAAAFCTHAGELQHANLPRFLAVLGLACMAARFKLKLPGLDGSMSVNLPFLLLGALQLSVAEGMVIAGISTLVQCYPGPGQAMRPIQMVFNVCNVANAVWLASMAYHFASTALAAAAIAGTAYFLADTVPVAIVVSLSQGRRFLNVYRRIWVLSFPYFAVGACLAGLVTIVRGSEFPIASMLGVMGVMCGVYASYRVLFAAYDRSLQSALTFAGD